MLDGDAIQSPSETVRSCPLSLVPETVGLAVATGALVMIAVEAVNWFAVPTELVATTRASRYLPILCTPVAKEVDWLVAIGVVLLEKAPVPS
jgi:predicted anti-sigma-YlaC factor YlaD